MSFKINSKFEMSFHQKQSVEKLTQGFQDNIKNQTLLGITGSGKTFTIANLIQKLNIPTLVMAPNKILAAQLYEEFKEFFPENAVEYFVSYYDYYRPEAYIPHKGIYIEKESSINETIDQLRHKATRSVIERKDVIIIASVSCIYGIGSYEAYVDMTLNLEVGEKLSTANLVRKLTTLGYVHSEDLGRGKISVRGQTIFLGPSHLIDRVWKISFDNGVIQEISEIDSINRKNFFYFDKIKIFPNSHHVIPENSLQQAIVNIQKELDSYLPTIKDKLIEHQRIQERVEYDIAQLKSVYNCAGIENYSRHFTNRMPGTHPPTLFEYFPKPFLLVVDESHITVPQIGGMSLGDAARKKVLIEHGFRMPSAKDNRPMNFEEWDRARPNTIFVSATPGEYEKTHSIVIDQIMRPTGLLDPTYAVKPTENQIEDAISELKQRILKNQRTLMLTLTKKTAENLTSYLCEKGFKVGYLHGDLNAIERIKKLYEFKQGVIDVIVGINLLREGIDIPECSLICIFEADCSGFLRTTSALIQMIGRAARNEEGHVILYADLMTPAMKEALKITEERRKTQIEYNLQNNIIPKTIIKPFKQSEIENYNKIKAQDFEGKTKNIEKEIKKIEKEMKEAIKTSNFEKAAGLRDRKKDLIDLLGKMS